MTIYATPFKKSTKQCCGVSADSGFESIDAVVEVMGEDYISRGKRTVIYGHGEDRVIFSDYIFVVDDSGTTG